MPLSARIINNKSQVLASIERLLVLEAIKLQFLKGKIMVTRLILSAILIGLGISLSACAGSTGWRVEFGISPVKSLNNQAGLKQETEAQ